MDKERKTNSTLSLLLGTKDMPKSLRAVWVFVLYDLVSSSNNLVDPEMADYRFSAFTTILVWSFTLVTIYNKNFRLFKIYRIVMGLYLAFYLLVTLANIADLGGGTFEENAFVFVLIFSFIGLLAVYVAMLWNKKYFTQNSVSEDNNSKVITDKELIQEKNGALDNNSTANMNMTEDSNDVSLESMKSSDQKESVQNKNLFDRLGLNGFKIYATVNLLGMVFFLILFTFFTEGFWDYPGLPKITIFLVSAIYYLTYSLFLSLITWYLAKAVLYIFGRSYFLSKENPKLVSNVFKLAAMFIFLGLIYINNKNITYLYSKFISSDKQIATDYQDKNYNGRVSQTPTNSTEPNKNDSKVNTAVNDGKYPEYFFEVSAGDNRTPEYSKALEYFNSSIGYLKNNELENALNDAYSSLSYYEHPSTYLLISDIYVNKNDPELAQYYIYKAEAFGLVYGQIFNMKANLAALRGNKDIARMNRSSGQMLDFITLVGAGSVYLPAYNIFYLGEGIPYDSVFGEEG